MSDPATTGGAHGLAGVNLRGADKLARLPIKIAPTTRQQMLRKPVWIRAEFQGTPAVARLKRTLRDQGLHTVCEEASCPNLGECFSKGTATFMVMGDICTRRCPFCDVGHGRPLALDAEEPIRLAGTVRAMGLKYVVITSVDRDDLHDGGAGHFAACIEAIRSQCPATRIEILTPDFRGRLDAAVAALRAAPPDVFNHNLETVPRLYRAVRPGADYQNSLRLLQRFKDEHPGVPTKTGVMLGLGETKEEIEAVMRDVRAHAIDMLTIGQYLQPTVHHLPVQRYVPPAEFASLREAGLRLGFSNVASGPMVRSSYHADVQAEPVLTP